MMDASNKILIVMTSGPETPRRCGTPFFLAAVAAAMEYEVEMICTIDGILLLKKGVADNLQAVEGGKPILQFIRDAVEAGAQIYGCTPALELHGLTRGDLIPECAGLVGGAHLISEGVKADLVLNF
jgi:predicted peroxiredoxin